MPVPAPVAGEVLIRVRAFGLNRSELHFRQGLASSGSFPLSPGIEAVGMARAVLAKLRDLTVLSTTRNPDKVASSE